MAARLPVAVLAGMSDALAEREAVITRFKTDRWAAHQTLFYHRHPEASCDAHQKIVELIYARQPRQVIEGFRGLAKSTLLEEAAVLRACYAEFNNMVILGSSYGRAVDRLAAIKRELEVNQLLIQLFGDFKSGAPTWTEGKIVLANGVCIQALGRDQNITGMKHLDFRPDAALIDDVEDPEEVRTDVERRATWDWFLKSFLPSLDDPLRTWVRVLGTRRGKGSLPERLEDEGWPTAKFPIEYIDAEGLRRATWPSRRPLEWIDENQRLYRGDMDTYKQEYMCEATSVADRTFKRITVEPRSPSWHAVYAMIDPARTVGRKSATTGWAVWSWIQRRLIVWGAGAEVLLPDQIIELCFTIHDAFDPVWLGVEKDGLEEFLMQPLRQEQARRGVVLPIRGIRAPRSKLDFIRGLQPYYEAGEAIHAGDFPELVAQLNSFPHGKIDAPNALAYSLQMRPAAPVYDSFGPEHIAPDLDVASARQLYLAANAERGLTTAALCQYVDGELRILADWVEEGAPTETVERIHAEAGLLSDTSRMVEARPDREDWKSVLRLPEHRMQLRRMPPRWVAPPRHADQWNNVGLFQAIGRIPAGSSRGAAETAGREQIGAMLSHVSRGTPTVQIAERARWTLRALAGGYTFSAQKGGGVSFEAEEGVYRTLMEGIESFAGMAAAIADNDDEDAQPIAYTKGGVAYRSALVRAR